MNSFAEWASFLLAELLADAMVVVCFLLAAFFPIAYRRSRWRKYRPGQALMYFSLIVTTVLALGVWRVFTGALAPEWIRAVAYVLIAGGLLLMDIVLVKEQAKDRQDVLDEQEAQRATMEEQK